MEKVPHTKILELRQQNKNAYKNSDLNGDYTVNITDGGNSIFLNQGDEISISNSFVDSTADNSNKIIIDDTNNTLTVRAGLGIFSYNMASEGDVAGKTYATKTGGTAAENTAFRDAHLHPDGQHYILTDSVTHPLNYVSVESISFAWEEAKSEDKLGVEFYVQYQDSLGNAQEAHFIFSKKVVQNQIGPFGTFKFTSSTPVAKGTNCLPFHARKATVVQSTRKSDISDMSLSGVGLNSMTFTSDNIASPTGFTPRLTSEITLNIPNSGPDGYSMSSLAELVTEELTKVSSGEFVQGAFTDNPFITDLVSAKARGDGSTAGNDPFFVRQDGKDFFKYNNNFNYWIGSSSIALIYNDEKNRFEVSTHNSIYNDSNQISIKLQESQASSTNTRNKFIANKSSFIYFTLLKPNNFWFKTLGLSQDILAPPRGLTNVDIGDSLDVTSYTTNLKDGISVSGEFIGSDSVIIKNSPNYEKANDVTYGNDQVISAPTTKYIEGNEMSKGDKLDSGYYKVELSLGFPSDVKGQQRNNSNIQGLVSRYYSQGSYSSDESNGFTYVHKSQEPLELNSIRVRILDGDNLLCGSTNSNVGSIGADNTIFVKIVTMK